LKPRNLFVFFVLPFTGVLLIFAFVSFLNRTDSRKRAEDLVRGQLDVTAHILGINISRLLTEGRSPGDILGIFDPQEDIYFMAILDEGKNVLAWNSRFEGYLPLSLAAARPGESGIIDSPAGNIFYTFEAVQAGNGRSCLLYLGHSLSSMDEMLARSGRNSLLFFGLLVLVGALFFHEISLLQARYMVKAREAEAERLEKERFREISAFTSGVAHEIKNPLNSLSLLFDLLMNSVPSAMKPDVGAGKDQVRTIAGIVDRFSSAVKPIRPVPEPLLLEEVVGQARESLLREFPAAAHRIEIVVGPGVRMRGDGGLLAQALLNLLKNALEASDASSIRVEGRSLRKGVEILVRDDGPGIPEADLGRVFEPFYSTKERGLGIGLYLSRKIIEAHGGRIEARNREGRGTDFHILFPGGLT
jgi:signal transduction histidine kinase